MGRRQKHQVPTRDQVELRPWYEIRAQHEEEPDAAELRIFGPIGGGFFFDPDAVSAKEVAEQLEELPDSVTTIRVFVDSEGGSVFDAQHIANALRRQREELERDVVVDIEAKAWSAATLITSAGNPVRMPRNALMMVHHPVMLTIGDAAGLRKDADLLDKITNGIIRTYQWISSLAEDALRALLDETTWMEADKALENGFITEISEPVTAAAAVAPEALDVFDIPEEYRDRVMAWAQAGGVDDEPDADEDPEGDGASGTDPDAAEADGEHDDLDDEPPAEPEGSDEPASATEILRMCREGDCLAIAEALIEAEATVAQVREKVARAQRITKLCEAAEMPDLADAYIAGGMEPDAIRQQLANITARMDSTEISGHVDPDASAKTSGRSAREIYAERNRSHFETTRQQER